MIAPKSILILGRRYPLSFVDSALLDDDAYFGECGYINPYIRITESIKGEPFHRQIIIHEILEAVRVQFCLEITHEQLSVLALAMWRIIAENPDLLTYLGGKK